MDYFYAQLDENNVCFSLSILSGKVEADDMIQITETEYAQQSVLGCKYNNGQWVEGQEAEPILPPPQPTNAEIKELLLINTQIQLEAAEEQRQASLLQIGIALEAAELILGGIQS